MAERHATSRCAFRHGKGEDVFQQRRDQRGSPTPEPETLTPTLSTRNPKPKPMPQATWFHAQPSHSVLFDLLTQLKSTRYPKLVLCTLQPPHTRLKPLLRGRGRPDFFAQSSLHPADQGHGTPSPPTISALSSYPHNRLPPTLNPRPETWQVMVLLRTLSRGLNNTL
jgi:hypothetical protein